MNTNSTLAVRAALESSGGAAENQLALIASALGDGQLETIVSELTAAEINVIVADADMSKASLVHAYVTPEQFSQAFDRLGMAWPYLSGRDPEEDFSEFQRGVEDFLCPMILASADAARIQLMLKALLELPLGCEALLFAAIGRKDFTEFFAGPTNFPIERGTWQELLEVTHEREPAKFREISEMAKTIAEEGLEGILEFLRSFVNAMHEEARKYQAPVEEAAEDFVDI